jgi:Tat protein translocase TatB subunit
MFDLGLSEIALILFIAAILLGPKKIPEIARALGKFTGWARKATDDFKQEISREINLRQELDEEKKKLSTQINDMASGADPEKLIRDEIHSNYEEFYRKKREEESKKDNPDDK